MPTHDSESDRRLLTFPPDELPTTEFPLNLKSARGYVGSFPACKWNPTQHRVVRNVKHRDNLHDMKQNHGSDIFSRLGGVVR